MKRTIALAVLLFSALFAVSAFADPVYLTRVNVKWRKAQSATVGAFADSSSFNQNGVTVADTTAPIDIRCLRPRLDVAANAASDSALWLRVVMVRNTASPHGGGWVNTPTLAVQLLSTPGTLGPAGFAAAAMIQRLGSHGGIGVGSADTSMTTQYSWASVNVGAPFVVPSWIRLIIPTVVEVGEFSAWVEFYTSCPTLVVGGQ